MERIDKKNPTITNNQGNYVPIKLHASAPDLAKLLSDEGLNITPQQFKAAFENGGKNRPEIYEALIGRAIQLIDQNVAKIDQIIDKSDPPHALRMVLTDIRNLITSKSDEFESRNGNLQRLRNTTRMVRLAILIASLRNNIAENPDNISKLNNIFLGKSNSKDRVVNAVALISANTVAVASHKTMPTTSIPGEVSYLSHIVDSSVKTTQEPQAEPKASPKQHGTLKSTEQERQAQFKTEPESIKFSPKEKTLIAELTEPVKQIEVEPVVQEYKGKGLRPAAVIDDYSAESHQVLQLFDSEKYPTSVATRHNNGAVSAIAPKSSLNNKQIVTGEVIRNLFNALMTYLETRDKGNIDEEYLKKPLFSKKYQYGEDVWTKVKKLADLLHMENIDPEKNANRPDLKEAVAIYLIKSKEYSIVGELEGKSPEDWLKMMDRVAQTKSESRTS
jgi:hypothetical protein